MNQEKQSMISPSETSVNKGRRRRWRWVVNLFLCLMVLAIGLGVSRYIDHTGPKAMKKAPQRRIPLVETVELFPVDHQISIDAMGTVVPAREVVLKARVAGQVQSLHSEFITGGFISKGERVLKVDPQDYKLAMVRKESQLINAQYGLKIEMGYQEVAQREWLLLNKGEPAKPSDVELALRKPHLEKNKSDVAAAQAELEQAKLNLGRTDVKAPFNALVREKYVDIGSLVSTQDPLADLVGTDDYWIRVSLPVDRLKWIHIPTDRSQKGAATTVHFRGHKRFGRVIRMLGNLETQGRMARILVSVKDPLGIVQSTTDCPPLLIGEYVRVTIQGDQLSGVYRIPRGALRDNDTVWLVATDGTLNVRPVTSIWRNEKVVLIENNLYPGDRLVISDLATPVNGMPVQTESSVSEKGSPSDTRKDVRHES